MHSRTSLALGSAKRRYDATAALIGLGMDLQGIFGGESGHEHPRPKGGHFKSVGVRCEARWRLLQCVRLDAPEPVCCAPIGRLSGSRKGAKAQRGTQRNAANCSRLIAMQQPRCILALPWLWDVRNGGTMQPPPSLAWGWISRGSTKESRGTNIPDPQGILRQFVGIAERHVASSHSRVC